MAVRYCERTMRRSNSRARESRLSANSRAPPSVQKRRQCSRLAANVAETSGKDLLNGCGENAAMNSSRDFCCDEVCDPLGVKRKACAFSPENDAWPVQLIATKYSSLSSLRRKLV